MALKSRYTVWINEAELTGLKKVKAAEGIAESEQVRQAIRDWLKRKGVAVKKPIRVQSRRATKRKA